LEQPNETKLALLHGPPGNSTWTDFLRILIKILVVLKERENLTL
jgi:hypothetical protein